MLPILAVAVLLSGAAPVRDEASLRVEIAALERAAQERPKDAARWNRLAVAYRRLARWSGDHAAEEKAARAVERALEAQPEDELALSLKGWVQAGRHDFEGAVVSARQALARSPEQSWSYGVLADALIELGRYPEAVAVVEALMRRRPGTPAYTRAAHLRSLHGDREGAIALMQLAVEASSPSDPEELAWCLVMLGREHQALGQKPQAQAQYRRALAALPDYHLALFHLAESQAATGQPEAALETALKLRARAPSVAVSALVGELQQALGRRRLAEEAFAEVDRIAALQDPSRAEPRWLARFYADRGRNLDRSIELVREELKTHQDVETWDGLAWALHRAGRDAEALEAADKAAVLGTDSARLLLHRGLIELALGREEGRARVRRALALGDLWPAERELAEAAALSPRSAAP
jgi:tetratricopeptide (TPR) repeat protein